MSKSFNSSNKNSIIHKRIDTVEKSYKNNNLNLKYKDASLVTTPTNLYSVRDKQTSVQSLSINN